MANAVVEGRSRALGAGFELKLQPVAFVVGVGKDEGDAIVAGGFAGDEAEMAGGVEEGREGQVFGGEGGLHSWVWSYAFVAPGIREELRQHVFPLLDVLASHDEFREGLREMHAIAGVVEAQTWTIPRSGRREASRRCSRADSGGSNRASKGRSRVSTMSLGSAARRRRRFSTRGNPCHAR